MFGFRKEAAFSPENPQAYDAMVRAAEMQGQLRATPYEHIGTTPDGQVIQRRVVAVPEGYIKSAKRYQQESPQVIESLDSPSRGRITHAVAAVAIASSMLCVTAFPFDGFDPNVQGKAANVAEGFERIFGMVKGQLGG